VIMRPDPGSPICHDDLIEGFTGSSNLSGVR
jgi:hypothetical protein